MSTTCVKPWFKKYRPVDDWQYLKVQIWSDQDLDVQITELSFRMSIHQALEHVFGQMGTSCYVNVLGWNPYDNQGMIKIKQSELTTVWSALASYHFTISEKTCAMDIVSSSAQLISLAE
ncbi:hypothetical protein BY458DRAFT_526627 [Sporodiniella umbellata]|nr:hypothetical protein BY458DRAFT_526627 [Sporodiniella umbellata]